MKFLAAFGLAIIIAVLDFLYCGFIIIVNDDDNEDALLTIAITNSIAFVLTLTLAICKLKLGIL